MSAQTVIGIDVSRDWLDGFCLPGKQRFRCQNSPDGHARLLEILQGMPDDLKVGFEATGGQEWALWRLLVSRGINAVQLPLDVSRFSSGQEVLMPLLLQKRVG